MPARHRVRYLCSMAEELHSQSTRVRDLIGSAHWLSDGHHKEYLLRDLIARYLPAGMLAARGFAIASNEEQVCSREQDILIVDTFQEPPVFNQGGLILAFPRTIVATISVKTTMEKKEVLDAIKGLNTVLQIASSSGATHRIWCGSYHFELGDPVANNHTLPYEYCSEGIKSHRLKRPFLRTEHALHIGPDILCSAKDLAFKLNYRYSDDTHLTTARARPRVRVCWVGNSFLYGRLA